MSIHDGKITIKRGIIIKKMAESLGRASHNDCWSKDLRPPGRACVPASFVPSQSWRVTESACPQCLTPMQVRQIPRRGPAC